MARGYQIGPSDFKILYIRYTLVPLIAAGGVLLYCTSGVKNGLHAFS